MKPKSLFEVIKTPNKEATMSSREIATLCEKRHDNVMEDIRNMLEKLELNAPEFSGAYKTGQGNVYECFNLPKRECLILVSGYNVKLRARIIDRWQELEAKEENTKPSTTDFDINAYTVEGQTMQVKLSVLDVAMKAIGVWDNSKLKIVNSTLTKSSFADLVEHLPQYTEDQPTFSLTHLLKEFKVRLPEEKKVILSSRAVNLILEKHGFIKQVSRASRSEDGVKFFWTITHKGRPSYGVNKIHIDNPNETQPHWYKDSFPELMERIGLISLKK